MKLYTHSGGNEAEIGKPLRGLFLLRGLLLYGLFALGAVACIFYAGKLAGLLLLLFPVGITLLLWIRFSDAKKAYIEIKGSEILTVDYCFGRKKERSFRFSQITHAELVLGSSCKLRGYRMHGTVQYIVLKSHSKYLFKIIACPEAKKLFGQ